MQVSKWGNSLAVRLPAVVVKALGLKEGDEIEISIAGRRDRQLWWRLRECVYLVGGEPKATAVSRGKDATPKQREGQAIMLT